MFPGRLDKDDLNTKLGQLARKIEEVKVEVHDALMKKHGEFYPLFDATVHLRYRVSDLRTDIDTELSVIEKQVQLGTVFQLLFFHYYYYYLLLLLLLLLLLFSWSWYLCCIASSLNTRAVKLTD